ncbi:hypothetical protein WA026_004879 [Henosepilachna vigintioctopunctata]|uniref:Uncharacterized protein n=1 Tax=Henosepilachna vigintioctopunctata TaxID=420089 RepID=A0AAW1ULH1_9CUCU
MARIVDSKDAGGLLDDEAVLDKEDVILLVGVGPGRTAKVLGDSPGLDLKEMISIKHSASPGHHPVLKFLDDSLHAVCCKKQVYNLDLKSNFDGTYVFYFI